MNFYFRTLFLFCLLITLTNHLAGQATYQQGYAILNSGDTIHAMIVEQANVQLAKSCRLKLDDNTIKAYTLDQLIEFKYNNGRCLVSKQIDEELC